jgi:hypothetical protein
LGQKYFVEAFEELKKMGMRQIIVVVINVFKDDSQTTKHRPNRISTSSKKAGPDNAAQPFGREENSEKKISEAVERVSGIGSSDDAQNQNSRSGRIKTVDRTCRYHGKNSGRNNVKRDGKAEQTLPDQSRLHRGGRLFVRDLL